MDGRAGIGLRWVRAAFLAAVAVGSGVVAHVEAGGLMPGRAALVVLCLACLLAVGSMLGRPASTLRVVTLVVAGQTFVHGALTAMSGHRGDPPLTRSVLHATPMATGQVHVGDGRRSGSLYDQLYGAGPTVRQADLTVPAPVQHLLADLTGPHAVMAVAHLVAAVLLGLWLAVGERALWAILTLGAIGLRRLLVGVLVAGWAVHAQLVWVAAALARLPSAVDLFMLREWRRGLVLARAVSRRGPPQVLPV